MIPFSPISHIQLLKNHIDRLEDDLKLAKEELAGCNENIEAGIYIAKSRNRFVLVKICPGQIGLLISLMDWGDIWLNDSLLSLSQRLANKGIVLLGKLQEEDFQQIVDPKCFNCGKSYFGESSCQCDCDCMNSNCGSCGSGS